MQEADCRGTIFEAGPDREAEAARVEALAAALGLSWVGVAYAHPPRAMCAVQVRELAFSCLARGAAVIRDAEAAARFVSVRFRPVCEGEDIDGDVTAEAYQPTTQCAELVASRMLDDDPSEPGRARVAAGQDQIFKHGADRLVLADLSYFVSRVHDLAAPHISTLRTSFPIATRGANVRALHLRRFLSEQIKCSRSFSEVTRAVKHKPETQTLKRTYPTPRPGSRGLPVPAPCLDHLVTRRPHGVVRRGRRWRRVDGQWRRRDWRQRREQRRCGTPSKGCCCS